MLNGTDISGHNSTMPPHGDFCIIKLTQGTNYVSTSAKYQVANARAQGQLIGFYHLAEYATSVDLNVRNFLHELQKYLQRGDNIVLDHEAQKPYYVPDAEEAAAWGLKWLVGVQANTHRRPWVYSNQSWARDGHCEGMADYPWWGAAPSVAKGELTAKGPFKRIVAHQYSDVDGVDRDVFYGTKQDWINLAAEIDPSRGKEENMTTGVAPETENTVLSVPVERGTARVFSVAFDSPEVLTYRVAAHSQSGGGKVAEDEKAIKVGGPASDSDKWPRKATWVFPNASEVDWVSIELVDGDPTVPNERGKIVRPGFQISA